MDVNHLKASFETENSPKARSMIRSEWQRINPVNHNEIINVKNAHAARTIFMVPKYTT